MTTRCPACKGALKPAGAMLRCAKCGGFYDDSPEEGGDYSDHNPAARLEREERERERRQMARAKR